MPGYVIVVLSVLLSTIVGLFVATRDIRNPIHRVYAALTLAFIVLSASNFLSLEPSPGQAFFVRTVMFSSTVGVYLLYLLIILIKGKNNPHRYMNLILGSTLVVAILDYTPVIFTNVITASPPQPVPGSGVLLYFVHFLLLVGLSARQVLGGIKDSDIKMARQYQSILLGLVPIILFAPLTSFILPIVLHQTQLIVVTPLYTFFFVSCVGYAMIRHGLFDIKLAAVRSVAYIFALSSLAVIYYLMAYIVSRTLFKGETTSEVSISPVNIFLALILAFLFQPIRTFFDRLSNSIFYRDNYSSDEFFAHLSELLASTTDLRGILERASIEIATTLKADQTFFFLYYTNAVDHHMSSGTRGHSRLPLADARALDAYVLKNNDEIILVESLAEDSDVRRLLISHKIALVMPLKHTNHVIGYVCLGEQRTSGYTKRDLKVLTTIANELVIAIQNALSVHEVREINATLKQRIVTATKELRDTNAVLRHLDTTKDEFVSMASHQLRTPLTSVKGYISMVMEGDAGKITDPQHYLLSEAFESSERMVRLINDFLNVSRLQTGKFIVDKHEIDIGKVVGQEVDSLRAIASSHGLRLTYIAPKQPELIWCDEDKIRQVIMNFVDNAIYYSRRDTTIHIAMGLIDNEVLFTVEDTGIGVPLAEQEHLFSKFFRATNARKQRPDGTGVGLFLAKKVITAHHGHVIFSSVEGQGSVFGFRLPLEMNQANEPDDEQDNNK